MLYRVLTPYGVGRRFDDLDKAKTYARQYEDAQIEEWWSDQYKFMRFVVKNGKCVAV